MKDETLSQLGCAGMVAVVALVIGGIGSLFVADATLAERGLIAIGVAAAAFVAAWLLAGDDQARRKEAVRSIRRTLVERQGLADAEFASQIPGGDRALGIQVRRAIAAYFQVPSEKIFPSDELRRDYQYDLLGPGFELYVVEHVTTARCIESRDFVVLRSRDVKNVRDLCAEVQQIIDGFAPTERDGTDAM
jgi:hypothetical protein